MARDGLLELRRQMGKTGRKHLALVQTPRVGEPAGELRKEAPGVEVPKVTIDLSTVPDKELGQKGHRNAETSKGLQAAVVAFRVKGYTIQETAKHLGMAEQVVKKALLDARASAAVNDVEIMLTNRAVPQAVEGLIALLESGDKDAIFETLKGRGAFRNHTAVKNEGNGGDMTLNVAFVMPAGREMHTLTEGSIVGVARRDDAAPGGD